MVADTFLAIQEKTVCEIALRIMHSEKPDRYTHTRSDEGNDLRNQMVSLIELSTLKDQSKMNHQMILASSTAELRDRHTMTYAVFLFSV